MFGAARAEAVAAATELRARLDDLERELVELSSARQRIAQELAALRARLTVHIRRHRGRMPAVDGTRQLPPVPHDATPLWGRRLRSVCLALLRRAGRLPLRELHALLHRHGYVIDSDTHVKVLADALGHEVDHGRARRVERGVYEVVTWPPPRPGRHGDPPLRPPVQPSPISS